MTIITKNNGDRKLPFDGERLRNFITGILNEFPKIDGEAYVEKTIRSITAHEEYSAELITNLLINNAKENVDISEPDWEYVAARIYLKSLYKQASRNRSYNAKDKYGSFSGLLSTLGDKGIYSSLILAEYSEEEIEELAKIIDPEKDKLFKYLGLYLLASRYLATDHERNVYELPQERFLVIAMVLMSKEPKSKRIQLVKEAYWALSNLYMTVATPTLANAGKSYGQLSSCFIDTVDDSLDGIYGSNWDVARVSKDGGGIGKYYGKVRADGSAIKSFKNASNGVVPWIKQDNNTAVSVDQLGNRPGAIAVYLDVWHADIRAFLDLKLENGDDRKRAHDVFLGACIPDLFMEKVEAKGDWYLFDPHEVRQVMGYSLEDYFDEEDGEGSFRQKYEECVQENRLTKTKVPAMDIMKRIMISQLETGTPYMFYRDEVNRMNPNKKYHEDGTLKTSIYCSNLCSEIAENMSATELISEEVYEENGEVVIVTKKKPGDFVVCNLSSINLGRAVPADVLERLIPIQVRMLDNVIDLNTLPVLQAQTTNQRYRAIGLGTFGWHHLLALEGFEWETEEAVDLADDLYKLIAFLTIQSSMELAKEKGAYPEFVGSEWESGEYFERRGYLGKDEYEYDSYEAVKWGDLASDVSKYGIRNGYLMAVAPNASTAKIGGSTDGIDPIYRDKYSDEKKDYKIPTVAPDMDHNTYNVYRKYSHRLDQRWSIRHNAARQKHIDQSQSFNFFVPHTIKASVLLELHMQAWKSKLKTTYYVRSTKNAKAAAECEWCSS